MKRKKILDYFEVREDGTVYNCKTRKLIGFIIGNKRYVALPGYGTVAIDFLVASAFCEKPLDNEGKPYDDYKIIHKNGDTLDDTASNLAWIPVLNKSSVITPKLKPPEDSLEEYYLIDTFNRDWETFDTLKEVANRLECSLQTVRFYLKTKKLFRCKYIISAEICDTLNYTSEFIRPWKGDEYYN